MLEKPANPSYQSIEPWGFGPICNFLCPSFSLQSSPPFPAFSVSITLSDMVVSFLLSATKRLWVTQTRGSVWQGQRTCSTKQGEEGISMALLLNHCRDYVGITCCWSNMTLNLQSILTWENKSLSAEQLRVRAGGMFLNMYRHGHLLPPQHLF